MTTRASRFPFGDGYWSLLLDRSFVYEGEIEQFLRSVADVDYSFVDGGANFGFWSVLASSRPFGSHPVIAIEAHPRIRRCRRNSHATPNSTTAVSRFCAAPSGRRPAIETLRLQRRDEAFGSAKATASGARKATSPEKALQIVALDSLSTMAW